MRRLSLIIVSLFLFAGCTLFSPDATQDEQALQDNATLHDISEKKEDSETLVLTDQYQVDSKQLLTEQNQIREDFFLTAESLENTEVRARYKVYMKSEDPKDPTTEAMYWQDIGILVQSQDDEALRNAFLEYQQKERERNKLDGEYFREIMTLARETEEEELLRFFAAHSNEGVRSDAAKNIYLPKDLQKVLVEDKSWIVRQYLGANRGIEDEIAQILAQDPDEKIRWVIALNPMVSPDILRELAKDNQLEVQQKLARNKNLPSDIALRMAEESTPFVVVALIKANKESIDNATLAALQAREEEEIKEALMEMGLHDIMPEGVPEPETPQE